MMRRSEEQVSDVASPLLREVHLRQTKDGGGKVEQIHEMGVYNSQAGTERSRALNNDMWLAAF